MNLDRQKISKNDRIALPWIVGVMIGLFGFLPPAYPDDDIPGYQQLKAEVVPVEQLFQKVQKEFEGIILELELEEENLRWIYEVKLLTPQGNVLKIDYDAKTMAVLMVKGQRDPSP
ncbi:MAG TPA: PepSY domain-containing protein [Nitrospirales bacterium]|nr:PepSY domain-containing protein [Nitrospira sp. MA-1]HNP60446.1 PepSY domain-containing protein [Nitrospirales bacterium]